MIDPAARQLQLTLASRREEIEPAVQAIAALLHQLGFEADARWRLELAAREAIANAVIHGNREAPLAIVRITAAAHDGELFLSVEDEGPGFDLTLIPDPRSSAQRLAPHGRGVFLMREAASEVHCEPRDGGGAIVTLRVRLPEPEGSSQLAHHEGDTLQINTRKTGNVTLLDLSGKLVIGIGDYALREKVRNTVSEGARSIVLNLEQVTTVDSSGIGELVSAYTAVSHQGGRLKLLKLSPKLRDILHITKLITVFEIFDEESEAVASFS